MSAARPGHRSTTRHAQAIYPFVNAGGLGGRGVYIGRDGEGGAFCYDPWVLYGDGLLDDPNAIVLGKLGQGKSALVKTLLWRMLLFGRRAFVLDVKREYGPLCRAVGVEPISLRPGGSVRLNPLASRPEEHAQLELLRAVTMTAVGGPLSQTEAGALREALRVVRARGGHGIQSHGPRRPGADTARDRRGPVRRRRPRWPAGCSPPPSDWRSTPDGPRSPSRTCARDRCAACSTARRPPGSTSTRGCWCSISTPCATHRRSGS